MNRGNIADISTYSFFVGYFVLSYLWKFTFLKNIFPCKISAKQSFLKFTFLRNVFTEKSFFFYITTCHLISFRRITLQNFISLNNTYTTFFIIVFLVLTDETFVVIILYFSVIINNIYFSYAESSTIVDKNIVKSIWYCTNKNDRIIEYNNKNKNRTFEHNALKCRPVIQYAST